MNVVLSPRANADILDQYRYYLVEQDAEAAAERFLSAVPLAIEALRLHPGIGSRKQLSNPMLRELRSWPVLGFSAIRLYYLHNEDTIRILRVLHGKRDIDPLFEDEDDSL